MRRPYQPFEACSGEHRDDEACCIRSATFKAKFAKEAFQYPVWGTPDWGDTFAKRSNVERGFSSLKNPDVIGLSPGLYRVRGRVKMSLLVDCMFAAHNLHLRMLDDDRRAKGLPRLSQSPRRRRGRKLHLAPPRGLEFRATAEGARAPWGSFRPILR